MNTTKRAKIEKIADLIELIHAPGNENNLDALRELLALSGHANAIDWSITANGLREYIHRLFAKAHTQTINEPQEKI